VHKDLFTASTVSGDQGVQKLSSPTAMCGADPAALTTSSVPQAHQTHLAKLTRPSFSFTHSSTFAPFSCSVSLSVAYLYGLYFNC
jgi:hypothetical protein